ncbi:MAG: hypothetical protein ABJO45_14435, partial [Lentilitoribacter sp.]
MTKPRTIYTVDALAGSGKTYDAIRWALKEAATAQRKTVMVFKSIDLIEQAYADAINVRLQNGWSSRITEIHSRLNKVGQLGQTVTELIQAHLSEATTSNGELLMITEAVFLTFEHWPNPYLWTCICDEIPDIAPAIKTNLPENHNLLTDYLKLIPMGDKYSEVGFVVGGKDALVAIAENPSRDEVNKVLSPIAKRLINPIYQTYVLTEQFNRVLHKTGEAKGRQLEMFSLLQPSVFGKDGIRDFQRKDGQQDQASLAFAEVIIMGAGFDISLLRRIWPALNVEFSPHQKIGRKLRYSKHTCGNRLSIQYVFDTDWSKSFANKCSKLDGDEVTNFEVLQLTCDHTFDKQPFVYLINKDREKQFKLDFADNGEQLPNSPWGLNSFQHIHNAAILSALNPTPTHIGFLKYICQSSDVVRDALFHSQVYQSVMRTSLRDLGATEHVQVVVPDRKSAVALAGYFQGCSSQKMALDLTETSKAKTGRKLAKQPKSRQQRDRDYK